MKLLLIEQKMYNEELPALNLLHKWSGTFVMLLRPFQLIT